MLEAAQKVGIDITGYFDVQPLDQNPYNLEYIGNENVDLLKEIIRHYHFIMGVGDNRLREKIYTTLISKQANIVSIIHPSAIRSETATIGNGTFISAGVIVNAQSTVGIGTILNTGSVIEHGCKIGNFSHIAPGAVLSGDVTVGDRSFIGANSVVIQGVKIGSGVIVGAGSVIIKDIPDYNKMAGNPGRLL